MAQLRYDMRPGLTDRRLAWAAALATFALMWATQGPVGHVRDEGYYFTAAASYEGWFVRLGESVRAGRIFEAFSDPVIVQYWEYNREHPPLAKAAFALSHLVFTRWLGWLDDTTSYRLPAFAFAGLLSYALYLLGRRFGRAAAIVAPVLFWAVPRHFFHAHLAAFDIPVTALWVLFLAAWARYAETGEGALKVGFLFGLSLATKHNAFFLPFVVGAHWLVMDWRDLRAAGISGLLRRVPSAMWAMAVLGPVVLYVSWPFLWHHPIERVAWWIGFHQNHVHYPWQYFGEILRGPPFPVLYPIALEAVTVPAATFVLLAFACVAALPGGVAEFSARVRSRFTPWSRTDWAMALGAVVAIAPFLTTRVPIFGGVKHWMGAVAIACVAGAALLVALARTVLPARPVLGVALLAFVIVFPGVLATAHFHPWGTSAYNEIAGGAAGGAALGMQRQYWSNNVTAVLPWIDEHAPRGASVYFHEVNHESFVAYQRDGLLRRDVRYAWSPKEASIAAYQYHQEFRDREFEIWTEFGTRTPSFSFAIDEAPQVVVYERAKR